jgi:hypothetical protein
MIGEGHGKSGQDALQYCAAFVDEFEAVIVGHRRTAIRQSLFASVCGPASDKGLSNSQDFAFLISHY